jgi:hypothetical protein
MRYLNGFVIIGVLLLGISIAGAASNNRFLTEPGQAPNPYAWMLYLAASALMLVNGAVSIWNSKRHEEAQRLVEAREAREAALRAEETSAAEERARMTESSSSTFTDPRV